MSDSGTKRSRAELLARRKQQMQKSVQAGRPVSAAGARRPPSSGGSRPTTAQSAQLQLYQPAAPSEPSTPQDLLGDSLASAAAPVDDIDEIAMAGNRGASSAPSKFAEQLKEQGLDDTYDPGNLRFEPEIVPQGQEPAAPMVTHAEFLSLGPLQQVVFMPPKPGQAIFCRIKRSHGVYTLYLENGSFKDPELQFMLAAKKVKGKYVITTQPDEFNGPGVVGRVKGNFLGTNFQVFDGGVNPHKSADTAGQPIRSQMAAVVYEANVMGYRGPRKMTVLLPSINPETGERKVFQPTSDDEGMIKRFKSNQSDGMYAMFNKLPVWKPETNSYVLDFKGRVTQASVKNFQVVHPDQRDYVAMQFGKVGEDTFTLDYRYPFCAMQAFGVALTSFDNKIAVE